MPGSALLFSWSSIKERKEKGELHINNYYRTKVALLLKKMIVT
jgi:hypothetical protein